MKSIHFNFQTLFHKFNILIACFASQRHVNLASGDDPQVKTLLVDIKFVQNCLKVFINGLLENTNISFSSSDIIFHMDKIKIYSFI